MLFTGFAISDSMFPAECSLRRTPLSGELSARLLAACGDSAQVCANPSHIPTFAALRERFGIALTPPATAPVVSLAVGDSLLVLGVTGLPRLDATRHEYTAAEIAGAAWRFGLWEVLA